MRIPIIWAAVDGGAFPYRRVVPDFNAAQFALEFETRFRRKIKEANAPDEELFMRLLDVKKRTKTGRVARPGLHFICFPPIITSCWDSSEESGERARECQQRHTL